jgi:hypothetical protein
LVQNRYAVIATIGGSELGVGFLVSYSISTSTIFNIFIRTGSGLADPNKITFVVYGIAPGPSSPPNQIETVIADNGLFGSSDLAATGQQESNFYLNKNAIVRLPVASEARAYAYVSNATPSGTASIVTIANSFGILRIESSANQTQNVYRVFLAVPFVDNLYTVVGTAGGSDSLVLRTSIDSSSSFLIIVSKANNPATGYPLASSFHFAVFRN